MAEGVTSPVSVASEYGEVCPAARRTVRGVREIPDGLEALAAWRTTYRSDGRELDAFVAVPDGAGPHPAIVFHHGSNGLMAAAAAGMSALVDAGYVVMAAVRRGHNGNPGAVLADLVPSAWGSPAMGTELVAALTAEYDDVVAALGHIRATPGSIRVGWR